MPCPFFMPEVAVKADGRTPLGDQYRGSCRADPAQAIPPPEDVQREICNLGYARGRCERFRGDVDAVRFSIAEGRLIWVMERDHAPVEHGAVELEQGTRDALLTAQARAFVESYRRRLAMAQATAAS